MKWRSAASPPARPWRAAAGNELRPGVDLACLICTEEHHSSSAMSVPSGVDQDELVVVAKAVDVAVDPPELRRGEPAVEEDEGGLIQYETDRARFLGRDRSVRSAVSVIDGRPLSNTVGAVLDPIFSIRCRVSLPPGATRSSMLW